MDGLFVALILPGAVFCCLMAMEWWETGAKPTFIVFGWRMPIWLIYFVVLGAGWMFAALWISQKIRRS